MRFFEIYILGPALLYLALREAPPSRAEQRLMLGAFGLLTILGGLQEGAKDQRDAAERLPAAL